MIIPLTDLARPLADDMSGADLAGYELYELPYADATVSNQAWQVLWSSDDRRAGVVFVGSGSSGLTHWTDAASPEDAVRRVVEDDTVN